MAPVPAVVRSLRIMELLVHERTPLTLSDIAARVGVPTASCHAILHTLLEEGYLLRRIDGRSQYWEPTLALYHLGSTLVTRFGVREVALPHLRALSAGLGLPVHLGVLVGADVMYLEKAAAPSFIQFDTYPGKLSPFHITALGRAIVAFLPPSQQDLIVAQSGSAVEALLAETLRQGYAVEDGEDIEGVGCVAAPVYDGDGAVIASVGVTGFSADLFTNGEIPPLKAITTTAMAVSAEMGYRPAGATSRG